MEATGGGMVDVSRKWDFGVVEVAQTGGSSVRQGLAVFEAVGNALSVVLGLTSGIIFAEGGAALSGRADVSTFGVVIGAALVVGGGGALTIVG